MDSSLPPEVHQLLADIWQEAKKLRKLVFAQDSALSNSFLDMMRLTLSYKPALQALYQQINFTLAKQSWRQWLQAHGEILREMQQVSPPYPQKDRRFRHKSWYANKIFYFIQRSYTLTEAMINSLINNAIGLDPKVHKEAHFFLSLILTTLSPTNFLFTNPELLRYTKQQKGLNLLHGLLHFLQDLNQWHGYINVTKSSPHAFKLGENIAATPGAVIYQNERMQLIQYTAVTDKVIKTPLLIVGSWINKYYVLDLQAHNSFIKWLVEAGFTVFLISWINPTAHHEPYTFEDYVTLGPVAAIKVIQQITQVDKVASIGYCLGGTLLMVAAAYWQQQGKQPLHSITLLTTLLDFQDPGVMKQLMGKDQLVVYKKSIEKTGMWDGRKMQAAFNLSRSDSYIWLFAQHRYGRGQQPRPLDAFTWSEDVTNIPGKLFQFYTHELFTHNVLINKKFIYQEVVIDLSTLAIPLFYLGIEQDECNPVSAVFTSAQALSAAKVHFVVVGKTGAGLSHVAGILNPPKRHKSYFYFNELNLTEDLSQWLETAHQDKGSWWPHWQTWIMNQGAAEVSLARSLGNKLYQPIEPAPGSFCSQGV